MKDRPAPDIGENADNAPRSAAAITFRLDNHSGVPPYLQLVHQVEHALRLGFLLQGDQLPRVRDVVSELSINPNTVMKAYRHLEDLGIAQGRPGLGTFITAASTTVNLAQLRALEAQLRSGWLTNAADSGLDISDIAALFMSTLRRFQDELLDAGGLPQSGHGAA